MSFDLSAILRFLARAIMKLVEERLAKTAVPAPPSPPTVPTVEARVATPTDRVLAAVVDLKLGPRAPHPAQHDVAEAAAALAPRSLTAEAAPRNAPAPLHASPDSGRDRIREAALETQADWRSRRILRTLAEPSGPTGPAGTTAGQSNVAPGAAPAADTALSQAQANLRVALKAYRALEIA
ncbi:hypothetical protein [Jiella avicenniae]|uniref:Uncharacterized protein n=1 Tax=Jiella avicenniae TaxID=2907202 RepID=A0A9X1P2A1_9HYPH|nr:hypothetical protein [Jiella avicenniae]MCE7028831.1 hypothetical protein [Jiella avicenniae]